MKKYLTFLRSLLKDRPYVKFVYMTGILPIAKYSSGSELNMFAEYTMAGEERFSEYFGFTEQEVDELYERYQKRNKNALKVSREGLKLWYDGYFSDMLRKEPSLGYVYRLANISSKMLQATLAGDTDTMSEIITYAHNTEVPILSYNNETELSAVINLIYLAARDEYRVEREDKAGRGFVDFIFYPIRYDQDCIILELKVDHTPEDAIRQICEKEYALRFRGKTAEQIRYTGRILAVGISYNKETKEHKCKVEVL